MEETVLNCARCCRIKPIKPKESGTNMELRSRAARDEGSPAAIVGRHGQRNLPDLSGDTVDFFIR